MTDFQLKIPPVLQSKIPPRDSSNRVIVPFELPYDYSVYEQFGSRQIDQNGQEGSLIYDEDGMVKFDEKTITGPHEKNSIKFEWNITNQETNETQTGELPATYKNQSSDNTESIFKRWKQNGMLTVNIALLDGAVFEPYQFYKIQLRLKFIRKGNVSYSEWSSVGLFQRVYSPYLTLESLATEAYGYNFVEISGMVGYKKDAASSQEISENLVQDKLKKGVFVLTTATTITNDGEIINDPQKIIETIELYPTEEEPNKLKGSFTYFYPAANYLLHMFLIMESGLVKTQTIAPFTISTNTVYNILTSDSHFYVKENNIAGNMELDIKLQASSDIALLETEPIEVIIKRASSKDNFKTWENIHIENVLTQYINSSWQPQIEKTIIDRAVENGVWYQYVLVFSCKTVNNTITKIYQVLGSTHDPEIYNGEEPYSIQKEGASSAIENINCFILNYEDIFLVRNEQQVKIKFNPSISNVSIRTADSITETLGGIYPIVRRNGHLKYKTYSLSGLISFQADDYLDFKKGLPIMENTSENTYDYSFYKRNEQIESLYATYNQNNNIPYWCDYNLEKEYRELLMNFLTDGKAKLLKIPSLGNAIIKLSDVQLEPEMATGAMIYNFTATATEITKCTIQNLDKYNIQLICNEKVLSFYGLIINNLSQSNSTTVATFLPSESIIYNQPTDAYSLILHTILKKELLKEDENE